jgi:hypothetical protein
MSATGVTVPMTETETAAGSSGCGSQRAVGQWLSANAFDHIWPAREPSADVLRIER